MRTSFSTWAADRLPCWPSPSFTSGGSRGLVDRAAKSACRAGHKEHKQGDRKKPALFRRSPPRLRRVGNGVQGLRGGVDRHGARVLGGAVFRLSLPALRPPIDQGGRCLV